MAFELGEEWEFEDPEIFKVITEDTPVFYKRPDFCTRLIDEKQMRVAVAAGEGYGWLEDGVFLIRMMGAYQDFPGQNFYQNGIYYQSQPPSWIDVPPGKFAVRRVPFVYTRGDYEDFSQQQLPFPDPDDGYLDLDPLTGILEAAGVSAHLDRDEGEDDYMQQLVDDVVQEPDSTTKGEDEAHAANFLPEVEEGMVVVDMDGVVDAEGYGIWMEPVGNEVAVDENIGGGDGDGEDLGNGGNGHGAGEGDGVEQFVDMDAEELLWYIWEAMVMHNGAVLVENEDEQAENMLADEEENAAHLGGMEMGDGDEVILELVDNLVELESPSEGEEEHD